MTNRNKFAMVETKSVYFDFDKAALRDEGVNEIEDVAKALKADPNAVVELHGVRQTRAAPSATTISLPVSGVDAVARYLVQRHVHRAAPHPHRRAWARSSWPPASGAATRCTQGPAGGHQAALSPELIGCTTPGPRPRVEAWSSPTG